MKPEPPDPSSARPLRLPKRFARCLLALAGLLSGGSAAPATPTIVHGPFEIVAQSKRISSGRFPNIAGNPFETREVTEFSVRFQGRGISAPSGDARFWRVLRLEGAPVPTLLLVTTSVEMLSERSGQLERRMLKPLDTAPAELQWLDANAGQPGPALSFGIERLDDPADSTRLAGGRWLRVGAGVVLDVSKLVTYKVEPWVPHVPGKPITSLSREGNAARAFSPGATQYVLAASGRDDSVAGGFAHGLLVVDIAAGTASELRVDRRRMRFAGPDDFDAAWIGHHFAWKRDAGGRERLEPRGAFTPWPWRGRLVQTSPGRWQYELARLSSRFVPRLQQLALRLPGAQAVPAAAGATGVAGATDGVTGSAASAGFKLRVGACGFNLSVYGRDDQPAERKMSAWVDDDPALAAECAAHIRSFAAAVDAELATGRHDALLLLD